MVLFVRTKCNVVILFGRTICKFLIFVWGNDMQSNDNIWEKDM